MNKKNRDRKSNVLFSILQCAGVLIISAIFVLINVFVSPIYQGKNVNASAKTIICIDPGHGGTGGRNLGAQYYGISEKEITLATALAMKEELEKYENVEVYLTRTSDVAISLTERANYAKAVNADMLFCLHYNSSVKHDLYGSEIWIPYCGELYSKAYSFAVNEMEQLQSLGFYQRGIKTRAGNNGEYYGIIRASDANNIPCALIEHCYIDHGVDLSYLLGTENPYEAIGKADATAVAKYFHLKSKALDADYSNHKNTTVKAPTTPQIDDRTVPEICTINSAAFNGKSMKVTANITAIDSQSPVIYYGYSFDGGVTWSYLMPWNRESKTNSVLIDNPTGAKTLTVKAHNQYDKETVSNTITIQ